MGWHGLLRVVDFQALLASQSTIAAALDKAQRASGTRSPQVKALREGYHLLAKVLWTRRASIQRVHDLAWLDHTSVEGIASDAVLLELFPSKGSDWIEISVEAFAGISPTVKLERGVAGPIRVGLVPEPRLKALYDAAATTKFDAPPPAVTVLGEIEALAASARRAGSPSAAVVFAASSFEDVPAE